MTRIVSSVSKWRSRFVRRPWAGTSRISWRRRLHLPRRPEVHPPARHGAEGAPQPKNPFFEHAEGTVFTAYEGGKCVGRVTAQIDREHLDRHKDETGFFGFLDTVDDPEVARELLARAESWLRQRGMKKVRGPCSLSINEELGCLVEGFDEPPVLMNPHHRPYQGGLIEKAGYTKEKDVYGWRYEVGDLNPRVRKARDDIRAMPEVVSRPLSKKDLERDVKITLDIFNDAWTDNWGFVPMTKKEAAKMAADLKLFLIPEITRIVTIDGEPAAVALAMPNVNELIRRPPRQAVPARLSPSCSTG